MESNQQSQPVPQKKLPSWLTTVTPFSKVLAMILFIALPFAGFYLGMKYQQQLIISSPIFPEAKKIVAPTPIPTSITSILRDEKAGFEINYPSYMTYSKTDTAYAFYNKVGGLEFRILIGQHTDFSSYKECGTQGPYPCISPITYGAPLIEKYTDGGTNVEAAVIRDGKGDSSQIVQTQNSPYFQFIGNHVDEIVSQFKLL